MTDGVTEFIEDQADSGKYEFAADSQKGIIASTGGSGTEPRPVIAPAADIDENRLIADTDPVVGEAVATLVDYITGAGFNIQPANVPGTDQEQTDEDIAELKLLVETSTFETELSLWVWHALVDGTGVLEIVVENDHFKPKVLPTEELEFQTDEFGNITQVIQEPSSGSTVEFEPHEVAILKFHEHPKDEFGHGLIERVREQADMLRDMEIDMARFVATKAYPPVVWQCGTEERPWSQNQINSWLDEVEEIEPDSMLAVGHDVDHDVAGVTSTSSTAGAMRLEPTFEHLMTRIATGLGVPADLMNIDRLSGQELQMVLQKFDRRIQRYRMFIRQVVRYQIFPSIINDSTAEEFTELPPDFEFGEHSSEEERLEADVALRLMNNGILTPEAVAKRLGIDPETELPDIWSDGEFLDVLERISGLGDQIQNPDGGRPTNTGGGTQSAGREVTTRQDTDGDNSNPEDRPQQAPEA